MKSLLQITLAAIILSFLYLLVGYVSAPTYAESCQGGKGQCRLDCESDEDPAGACVDGVLTCCVPKGGKPNCDCNSDPECGPGYTCDEGGSAGCTPFNGKEGLCKPSGGSSGGGGTLPPPAGEIDLGIFKISTNPKAMAQGFLDFGIKIGTLLAILFIIIGGYGVATSGGNADNLEKAKKQITAAVAGLIFILLSVAILNIIGVEVIGIPFSF